MYNGYQIDVCIFIPIDITLDEMSDSLLIKTTDEKYVDVGPIRSLSSYLVEMEDMEDDGSTLQVMVGNPETVHQKTLDAVEAIKMLPELTRLLNKFNCPGEAPLESMKTLHGTITELKTKWKELSKNNEVYDWLFPLPEYKLPMICNNDVYSFYCENAFPGHKNAMFRLACGKGHLEVAEWVYSLGDVDIHALGDYAFRWACGNGHLKVAKWVYSLGDVNIYTYGDYAFWWACKSGHLEVAKWIYSLGGVDIHVRDDYAFQLASRNGHLEVAKWLKSF